DVAGCLVASDMLLARLQRHAERRLAVRIARHADDAPGKLSLELVFRGKKRGVRSAVAQRHAKALRVADGHVGTPLARGREQDKAQEVRCRRYQRAHGMHAVAELTVVVDGAVRRWIL